MLPHAVSSDVGRACVLSVLCCPWWLPCCPCWAIFIQQSLIIDVCDVYSYMCAVWLASVLSVLGMVPVLAVLARVVIACPCRVGVIRAVLGFGGPCRVEISVLACPCRVLPSPDIYIYIYIYVYIYVYIYIYIVCASRIPPRPLEALWARGLVPSGSASCVWGIIVDPWRGS